MFSWLSVKALEQASAFQLTHYTLIYDFSRFLVLESRFRCELFDSERNVLDFWERTLRDCPLHVGPIHEIQQRGVLDVQVTPIDSIGRRTILSCQGNGFAKCLDKSLNLAAGVNQQAARDREIYAGANIEFQALVVGQHAYFVHLASAFQIEEVVFVARRRIDLTFQKGVKPLNAPAPERNQSNIPVRIESEPLQGLPSDPVLAAVRFAGAYFFSSELFRSGNIRT